MSHWQQEPIRYLETSTPQPSDTIRSLRKKIEEYEVRFRQQEEEIHRLLLKLQEKDMKIRQLEFTNGNLKSEIEHFTLTSARRIDDSIHQLSNVNELEYNVKNRIYPNDIKKFRVEELRLGGGAGLGSKSNRSFEKEPVIRQSILETSLVGSIQSIKARDGTPPSTSLGKVKTKHTPFKMFESFLIVQGNLAQLGQSAIDPKIVFSYPMALPADREKIVPMFCYPQKMKPRFLTTEQQINHILEDLELQSSIFILNSQFTTTGAMESRVKNHAVSIANPNFNLFGVCLRGKVVAQMGSSNYELSKTYVVLTYFPFVRFFLNLLAMTINSIKAEEINAPPGSTPNIEKAILKSFEDLSKVTIDKLPVTIKFRCQGNNLHLSVPQPPYTDSLTSSYALYCIPKIDVDIIINILLLMLLESSIVIYSKDVTLLSQLILLLIQTIRPLRYPHPIIVNLPKQMEMVLESPFPTLIGLSAPLSHIESQSVYFNVDAKQQENIPDIPALKHLADYIRSSIQKKNNQNDIFNRIKHVIEAEIIKASMRDKQTQHQGYVDLFRKTQIYKYYCQ